MPTFEDYLRQSFPNIRITSGARDPNSRLGRANPRSWHNQGKAWDTAPVEGMSYDQYVDRIKQDGWDVLEARDEVKNPSKHATGPHWHVAVGGRKEPQVNNLASLLTQQPQMPQQQPQGLAGLLQPQMPQQPQMPNLRTDDLTNIDPQSLLAGLPEKAKRPVWKDILGSILDTIATASGHGGGYWPTIQKQQDEDKEARRRLDELMALQQQKQADRDAALQDWKVKDDYRRENLSPTNAARMAQEAGFQPGTPQYQQAILQYMQRPIMIGGEAYGYGQPQQQGGFPSGYSPDEWEVIE